MSENIKQKNRNSICVNNLFLEFFPIPRIENSLLPTTQHSHSHAEIFSCNNGSIQLNFPHDSITINAGDLAIIPAGIKHSRTPSTAIDTIWNAIGIVCSKQKSEVIYTENIYSKLSPFINGNDICIFRNNPDLCSVIHKIGNQEKIDIFLSIEFIYELYKSAKDKKTTDVITQSQKRSKDIDRFIVLDRVLNFEYMQPISTKEIADKLYICERHLSRLILSHYGAPLHKLILKRRIEVAATQISNTSNNIEDIAHSVGFSNKRMFYKEFKSEFGITPAQYRKIHKA